MPKLVMKFGGTSVADLDCIKNAASKISLEVNNGFDVIVIVSAMSGETNRLVSLVNGVSKMHDAKEYDAIVSSGENVTAGLMAVTLQEMGVSARSWQGWQVPLITNSSHSSARIIKIPTDNLEEKFSKGMRVAVIAGFQGISEEGRLSTLGRGGSDTTAVAFASAFEAERCDIYTDVDGIYTTDPRITSKARKLSKISPGTLVCDEEEIMESKIVSGVAYSRDEAKMTLVSVADRPGIAASIFGILADKGVNVDMIVQNVSEGGRTDMTFSCPVDQVDLAELSLDKAKQSQTINYHDLIADTDVSKISVVGIGMRSHAGVAAKMFEALSIENINIKVITTSEIKISVLIDRKYMELAIQSLHDVFELEAKT
jgi:aspartate kinase